MIFSRDFFDLNLRFARKVATTGGMSFEDALLNYTHCYVRFTAARDFASDNPVWRAFVDGLRAAEDALDWTYAYYRELQAHAPSRLQGPQFGCFSYNRWQGGLIRLHFHNEEIGDEHPLSLERMPQRLAELRALFTHVREQAPDAPAVHGGTWLYNLKAYRRLFPPEYLASAVQGEGDYGFMALWGQFLDRRGEVRPGPAAQFLERLNRAETLEQALDSFPLKALYVEADVAVFHAFYGSVP